MYMLYFYKLIAPYKQIEIYLGVLHMKRYEIYKHIGNLSPLNNGWIKELNLISWDNKEPVYDIRTWNSEHTEYGKGVTITAGQMVVLKNLLNEMSIF